jgi:predicted phosphodiesterase
MSRKRLSWLHISDMHIKTGDPYDRDMVLNALIASMKRFLARGLKPDLVFFTGDVAYSGDAHQYKQATKFFDKLLEELHLSRDALLVIPGNHDVDRTRSRGLKRTLESQADSNFYFGEGGEIDHISGRQAEFIKWHNEFFEGIRSFETQSTCGPYIERVFDDFRLDILPINTAAFCLGNDDHGKLWIGRRCLDAVINAERPRADLTVALMHHPLDWLNEDERAQITSKLYSGVDCILRGHLHKTDLMWTEGTAGSALHLAAGACYQGSESPNKATFVEVYDEHLRVVPIRFDDSPTPLWTVDSSIFPDDNDFSGKLVWRRRPSGDKPPLASTYGGQGGEPTLITGLPIGLGTAHVEAEAVRKSFEQDLFEDRSGQVIYVEPRLSKVSQDAVSLHDSEVPFIAIQEIIDSKESYVISVPPECGGTSLSKRLAHEFLRANVKYELRDALSLSNYRAKLRTEFQKLMSVKTSSAVLVLDNFNHFRHEKLLREVQSLGIFNRYVIITTVRGFKVDVSSILDGEDAVKSLYMWTMSRAGIREMASSLMDTADVTYLSSVVEKVYGDLLALSIPLTPSNVVMYLKVLDKEQDFHPFNRVDIVQKYLASALSGSAEMLSGAFNSREKMDILSEFSYTLFERSVGSFTDKEWFEFCERYMADTLSSFSARDFLRNLEESRVVVRIDHNLYFKYGFFFSFLVGRYIANRPELVKSFLDCEARGSLNGVIETIAALTGDGTAIVDHITSDLETKLDEFAERYVPFDFDPLSKAEWLDNNKDAAMWEAVSQQVEEGPVPATELDLIRTSFSGEARTLDQEVRYSELKELEYEVFYTASILGEVLKASHGVRGPIKKRAVIAFLRTDHIAMQIGTILAREIAKRDWFQWGGAIFIGFKRQPGENEDENSNAMAIVATIPSSVVNKSSEDIGSGKLGEVFKAAISEQDPESFLSLLLFGCLVRTKPPGWEDCVKQRIAAIGRRAFYLAGMVNILMREFKTGINTQKDRDALRRLIATVHAKRSHNKTMPGSKLVRSVLLEVEKSGVLAVEAPTAEVAEARPK